MRESNDGTVPKNLVVCCDGTGKAFGDENTNVVGLYDAIHKDDLFSAVRKQREGKQAQLAFYDPGVGSLAPDARFSMRGRLGMTLSKAFGTGFRSNVLDGYRFLMANYQSGDRVFLYGFSRGAFTVRWLAGIIHKVGLLHRGNENLLDYALHITIEGSPIIANGFKEAFSRECKPQVVGVWDTVSSLGLLLGRTFPDLQLNPDVAHAFQALSLDERRQKFPAVLWDEDYVAPGQEILQVWFPGDHSDVGGGHPQNRGLSYVTLSWMLEHSRRCGLLVKDESLSTIRGAEDWTEPHHDLYTGAWRLLGYELRKVPPRAKLHESVRERMRALRDYRPKMLPQRLDRLEQAHPIVATPRSELMDDVTLQPPPQTLRTAPNAIAAQRAAETGAGAS